MVSDESKIKFGEPLHKWEPKFDSETLLDLCPLGGGRTTPGWGGGGGGGYWGRSPRAAVEVEHIL